MRNILNLNEDWTFLKGVTEISSIPGTGELVSLPHTWNDLDGQDGGNDYFRGACSYVRKFGKDELPAAERYYLEIRGANSSADVYVNGKHLAHHDGGYSTWRVELTEILASTEAPEAEQTRPSAGEKSETGQNDEFVLSVVVDNAPNDAVYPQTADFTFYGGLYRDVRLIAVPKTHFDLDYFGGEGLKITPVMDGDDANVEVEVFVSDLQRGDQIVYTVFDAEGNRVAEASSDSGVSEEMADHCSDIGGAVEAVSKAGENSVSNRDGVSTAMVNFTIKNAHRWDGRRDPYLYSVKAAIIRGEEAIDSVSARFGCRSFVIDPERGFILNGREYPLHGVSRHQDRLGIGNALLPEHHREDMDLICEVGANTIRLAHYQHDQYFYDLCDERGMIIWAEIPYISNHLSAANDNAVSQMKELIVQNYNHPSIVVWGLSNEITMGGAKDPDLLRMHYLLNDLVHHMDKTRPTVMACLSMCGIDEEYVHIPDVVSYNHYFGWYGGDTSMNGPWFDKFHAKYPNKAIGVSEYGCEALNWHTSTPTQGDYTEEYQAYYHEELIKQLFTRPYIWATHVWNMFDFGADARAEGGENGQNHKGLVTMDRKYKKDSFYAYKAWLSDEPFVHLCGKRYIDRVEEVTKVTVYSNLPEVELFANGVSVGRQTAEDHFFYFNVKNEGETTLTAVAGEHRDEGVIRKVDAMNEDYILKEKGAVLNWFDITAPEGRFSLNDKLGDIMGTFGGKLWFLRLGLLLKKKMSERDAANKKLAEGKAQSEGKDSAAKKSGGFSNMTISKDMIQMMGGFTVIRLTGMVGMINISFTKGELLKLNAQLNRIRKPGK
ncbi:MAG: glycoside hydrolase family 2 protein [Lachnospiraceae bacterium]|nr:glycoside hydrolase family 2 protein [Lachnospiraceae bacterium]